MRDEKLIESHAIIIFTPLIVFFVRHICTPYIIVFCAAVEEGLEFF